MDMKEEGTGLTKRWEDGGRGGEEGDKESNMRTGS
jgi:hypothetical protein